MLEGLRSELDEYILALVNADFSNLTDPLIVAKSQELDIAIVQAMKGGESIGCKDYAGLY